MKATILNTASLLNPGDTAIVLAQIQFLRTFIPGLSLSLTSRTATLDRPFFKSRQADVFPPVLPGFSLYQGLDDKIRQVIRQGLDIVSKRRLIEEIRSSDFVISSGGGCFYSNRRAFPGPTFIQNILHVGLAQAMGKPVIFFPQSFGPFSSRIAQASVLGRLRHPKTAKIFVRENLSYDALLRLGDPRLRKKMELCPDMAFYLKPEERDAPPDPSISGLPRPRIIMTLRRWDFPQGRTSGEKRALGANYLAAFRDVARTIVQTWKGSVVILPHTRGPGAFEDDSIISRGFWEELRRDIPESRLVFVPLPGNVSPFRMMDLYALADAVLGTRTHSAIFALLRGVPAVSVYYQPKGLGMMEALGLADHCLSIADLSAAELLKKTEDVLRRAVEVRRTAQEKISALRPIMEAKLRSAFAFLR
jgi:colanic acid/amylovoran biosynthesis protein